jgi:hypothetical protein
MSAVDPWPQGHIETLRVTHRDCDGGCHTNRWIATVDLLRAELAELAAIKRDVPSLHQRTCHDCDKTHWHADDRTPYVLCPECGSQDTRRVKS